MSEKSNESKNEDRALIMKEVVKLSEFSSAMQTVLNFVWWISAHHGELFTEYLNDRSDHK